MRHSRKPNLFDVASNTFENFQNNIDNEFHCSMLRWAIGVLNHEFGYEGPIYSANKYLDEEINNKPIYNGLKDNREELIKQIKMVMEETRNVPNAVYTDKDGKEHLCYIEPTEDYNITVKETEK